MKAKHIILSLLLGFSVSQIAAQDNIVRKASKSVFTLTTYSDDGTLLATTHGAYCGNAGEGISSFSPFIGATVAVVIDGSGNKYDVDAIIGANEVYDICRFRLSSTKGTPLQPAKTAASGKVWVVGYSTKKADITPITVKSTEDFAEKYHYYVFNEEINDDIKGCPIVNDAGEIVGLAEKSSSNYSIHSTDANYYSELASTGLSAHNATLKQTHIRTALPSDHEQARLMLIMMSAEDDSMSVVKNTKEYIERYPDDIDGYSAMARYETTHLNFGKATTVMETAIKKMDKKDEAYREYAELVYNTVVYIPDSARQNWSLDLAEETIGKAIAINNLPIYRHLLAQIKYAKQDYTSALTIFEELGNGDMASSEVFYEIAQCKSQLGAQKTDILECLNKAVEASPKPLTSISAPYILARGMALDELGDTKQALQDYNQYDTLMNFRAGADFYYTRYKCEVKRKQFQQAINDISHAAVINPGEPTYLAELASLQLRVGKFEEAVQACDLCLRLTTEYSDVYIVKGVALNYLGRKEESIEALQKAKELGDERADAYIEKYSKAK
jgi:tetratricopeptide (TPR) repeat protein